VLRIEDQHDELEIRLVTQRRTEVQIGWISDGFVEDGSKNTTTRAFWLLTAKKNLDLKKLYDIAQETIIYTGSTGMHTTGYSGALWCHKTTENIE
jgi:hypothetical protein